MKKDLARRRRRGRTRRQRKIETAARIRREELAFWKEFAERMEKLKTGMDQLHDSLEELFFILEHGAEARKRGIELVPHGFHGGYVPPKPSVTTGTLGERHYD